MNVVYRTRPYEAVPGSVNALHEKWKKVCIEQLTRSGITASAPSASSNSIMWLLAAGMNLTRISPTTPTLGFLISLSGEAEGAEAVMPDLMGFLLYCMQNSTYKHELLKTPKKGAILSSTLIKILETFRKAGTKALAEIKTYMLNSAYSREGIP